MKRLHLTFAFLFSLLVIACDDEDESVIAATDLPTTATTFIETHFPEAEITQVIKDEERNSVDYEVRLNNNFDLDFDENGNWTEVDGLNSQVPDSIIPTNILSYTTTNHTDQIIIEINKQGANFEIQLDNRLEILFDADGNFIRSEYDD